MRSIRIVAIPDGREPDHIREQLIGMVVPLARKEVIQGEGF